MGVTAIFTWGFGNQWPCSGIRGDSQNLVTILKTIQLSVLKC